MHSEAAIFAGIRHLVSCAILVSALVNLQISPADAASIAMAVPERPTMADCHSIFGEYARKIQGKFDQIRLCMKQPAEIGSAVSNCDEFGKSSLAKTVRKAWPQCQSIDNEICGLETEKDRAYELCRSRATDRLPIGSGADSATETANIVSNFNKHVAVTRKTIDFVNDPEKFIFKALGKEAAEQLSVLPPGTTSDIRDQRTRSMYNAIFSTAENVPLPGGGLVSMIQSSSLKKLREQFGYIQRQLDDATTAMASYTVDIPIHTPSSNQSSFAVTDSDLDAPSNTRSNESKNAHKPSEGGANNSSGQQTGNPSDTSASSNTGNRTDWGEEMKQPSAQIAQEKQRRAALAERARIARSEWEQHDDTEAVVAGNDRPSFAAQMLDSSIRTFVAKKTGAAPTYPSTSSTSSSCDSAANQAMNILSRCQPEIDRSVGICERAHSMESCLQRARPYLTQCPDDLASIDQEIQSARKTELAACTGK